MVTGIRNGGLDLSTAKVMDLEETRRWRSAVLGTENDQRKAIGSHTNEERLVPQFLKVLYF